MIKFKEKYNTIREFIETYNISDTTDVVRSTYEYYKLDSWKNEDKASMYEKPYEEIKELAEKLISIYKLQQ